MTIGERETREIFSPGFMSTRKKRSKEDKDNRKVQLVTEMAFFSGTEVSGKRGERGHMMCLIHYLPRDDKVQFPV